MIERIFLLLLGLSPEIKRRLWHWWYQYLARAYQKSDWTFMNYGFCDLNSELSPLNLMEEEEENRYFIQLYHYVATATDLKDQQVLEVGSGRGGGAAYIATYLKPKKIVGIDFSEQNIQIARKISQNSNLSFQLGDAEALPFENNTFDVVLNVESSHCYGSMTKFAREVYRVLKPGGIFSWADMYPIDQVKNLKQDFENSGLFCLKNTNITPQVLKALELINERKQSLIENYVPSFLKNAFQEFAAVKDTKTYKEFQTGKQVYLSFVFRK